MKTEPQSSGELAELLSGDAAITTIMVLQSQQRSRNLLLLRRLLDLVDESAAEDGAIAHFPESFDMLCAVEAAAPAQVARLLAGPHFGAWVAACLRRLIGAEPAAAQPLWIDLAHLGALVISFAIAAEVEAEAAVPSRSGRVVIPGIGCVRLEDAAGWEMTVIQRHGDGTLTVRRSGTTLSVPRDPPADFLPWQGIRHLRGSSGGLHIEVELDDLDPYRDRYGLRAAGRLADSEADQWQDQFARAWSVLAGRHRDDAAATAATLRAVIPLAAREAGRGVSATLRYASGAISLTPQTDEVRLARTLVHELHHMKLNLLMDSVPLCRTGHQELFYSPWRDDPRPLAGLLHGLYAGVAVADFWRAECTGSHGGALAEFELARIRGQVEIGLPVLTRSEQFTSAGLSLRAAMATVVASWPDGPVDGYPALLADDLVADHLIRWRLRNLVLPDRDIARLAAAWRGDRPPPSIPRPALGVGHRESFAEDARLRLADRALANRALADRALADRALADRALADRALADDAATGNGMSNVSASQADLRLISGDYEAAAAAYRAEISAGIGSPETWAGLAVSRRRLAGKGSDAIIMRPELVRALYDRLSANSVPTPSPLDIADWLAPACLDEQEPGPGEPSGVYLPVTLKAPRNRIPPGGRAPR